MDGTLYEMTPPPPSSWADGIVQQLPIVVVREVHCGPNARGTRVLTLGNKKKKKLAPPSPLREREGMERPNADLASLQVWCNNNRVEGDGPAPRPRVSKHAPATSRRRMCRAAGQALTLLTRHTHIHTQANCKHDPEGYVDEFETQVRRQKDERGVFRAARRRR